MLVKLFVFGLPGSGKSTVARHIVDHVQRGYKNWSAQRISDYNILHKMFLQDKKREHFYPVKYGGFYVTDPSVYHTVLKAIEGKIEHLSVKGNKFLVIDFARSDYTKALKTFGEDFLQNSFFLFLMTDIDTCIRRVEERIKNPSCIDNHFVSEYTFENYSRKDDIQYPLSVSSDIEKNHGIWHNKFEIIDSGGTKQDTITKAKRFVDEIIRQSGRSWSVEESRLNLLVEI